MLKKGVINKDSCPVHMKKPAAIHAILLGQLKVNKHNTKFVTLSRCISKEISVIMFELSTQTYSYWWPGPSLSLKTVQTCKEKRGKYFDHGILSEIVMADLVQKTVFYNLWHCIHPNPTPA